MLVLDAAYFVRDAVERGRPVSRAITIGVPDEGRQQPVRMAALQVALDPFGAEHAAVHGEVLPGLETNDRVLPDLELDTTLYTAEAAVRLYESVRDVAPLPAPRRGVVEMRTIVRHELCERLWQGRHEHQPPVTEPERYCAVAAHRLRCAPLPVASPGRAISRPAVGGNADRHACNV